MISVEHFNNFDHFLMKTLILFQIACPQWYFDIDSLRYFSIKSYNTKTKLEFFYLS